MSFSTPTLRASGLNRSSPHFRPPGLQQRSPERNVESLQLKRVIGTTASSNNGFDSSESSSSFAFIAGSGAVLATFGKAGHISQRFLHAKPAVAPSVTTPSIYDSPTPLGAQHGARSRALTSLRESGIGPVPASPDALDSPNAKRAAASRSKAATCVALSPDGHLLAIGETGHRPRVLIFSTAWDTPRDVPQNALSEHTFGVRCLAFSPDSQYLASLGDVNDGFLYIWSLSSRSRTVVLHASNKCTSTIRQIAWMGGSLITAGVRHVKIWRLEEGGRTSPSKRQSDAISFISSPGRSRALLGRNCLLGPLLDKTFTCVVAVSSSQAIACTNSGDVCLLDDRNACASFAKIAEAGFAVTAAAVTSRGDVLISGDGGRLSLIMLGKGKDVAAPQHCPILCDVQIGIEGCVTAVANDILAMKWVSDRLVMLDSSKKMSVLDTTRVSHQSGLSATLEQSLPAHSGPVLGLCVLSGPPSEEAFMTWSAEGAILFWDVQGSCTRSVRVPMDQQSSKSEVGEYGNELRVVRTVGTHAGYLITGDRFGILRTFKAPFNEAMSAIKVHGQDMTDIAVHEEGEHQVLVASSSRDRTVQLFRWESDCLEHLQTMAEHTGAVTGLLFADDGRRLVSCSSDRTIIVSDAAVALGEKRTVGFLTKRVINLKTTPTSMSLIEGSSETAILVSSTDRHVTKYNLGSGAAPWTFKTGDQDGGDSVMLSSAVHVALPKKSCLVAGVSSTDKSIRVYDESGRLLDKQHGHTEGMTGIGVVSSGLASGKESKTIVTVASDGTIFMWKLQSPQQQMQEQFKSLGIKEAAECRSPGLLASRPPMRKLFSSQELTRLTSGVQEEEGQCSEGAATPAAKAGLRREPSKLASTQRSTQTSMQKPGSPAVGQERKGTIGTRSTRRRSLSAGPAVSRHKMLGASPTEGICRSLRMYRNRLSLSSEPVKREDVEELRRELSLTSELLARVAGDVG